MRALRVWLFCLACLLLPWATVGCGGVRLVAGMNDLELTFATDPLAPPAPLEAVVRARLAAARLRADVREEPGGIVRITVDELAREDVIDVLTWTGGVTLFVPKRGVAVDADGADGRVLPDGAVWAFRRSGEGDGPTLRETRADGSERRYPVEVPACAVTREGPVSLGPFGLDLGPLPVGCDAPIVALARGGRLLTVERLPGIVHDGRLVLPVRDDPGSRARAQALAELLSTRHLPPLSLHGQRRSDPHYPVAVLSVLLPWLVSLAWLSFIRRFDRAHPEPLRLVLLTFVLGALAVVPAGAAEWAFERLSPYFSPENATAGDGAGAFLVAVPLLTFTVGFAEEASKFLVVWLFASRTKEFDEPVDGIVYGVAASLGFATIENMKFFALARLAAPVIVARSLLTVPAHMFFGTLWGYALGRKLVAKKTRVLGYLLVASVAHGVFDASLGTRGFWPLALLVNGALTTAFVVLVRRALRRGVVSHATRIVESTRRALFSVGRRRNFALSLAGLYAFGALLFLFTATYMAGETLSLTAVLGGTALACAVGVSAYAVPTTMPLDVAIDATGITYAGSAIDWRDVHGVSREGAETLMLHTTDGDVEIGPGRDDVLERLAEAIRYGKEEARAST